MKASNRTLRIVPQATAQLANGEAAVPGQGVETLNLRQREEALEVMGAPTPAGQIAQGHTLLLADDGRLLTTDAGRHTIYCNGTAVATASDTVTSAHRVGSFVVVTTSDAPLFLHRHSTGYTPLDPADALPVIHLGAVGLTTLSTDIDACTFAQPLSQWQMPLPAADRATLTGRVRTALTDLLTQANEGGLLAGPALVRYGVRLWDDSYLWLSAPVLVGHDTLQTNWRATTNATSDSSGFTGIEACSLQLRAYRLGITVVSGVATAWQGLVKSIDVLATPVAVPVRAGSLDYRMGTTRTGTRAYRMELGPAPRSAAALTGQLMGSDWRLVASTTAIATLGSGFTALNTATSGTALVPGLTTRSVTLPGTATALTGAQCAAIVQQQSQQPLGGCAISLNGRRYHAPQTLRQQLTWNPLTAATALTAGTCTVRAVATLSTVQGLATVTRIFALNCVPAGFSPLVAVGNTRATHLRIEVSTAASTQVIDTDLDPWHEAGIAAHFTATLAPHALASGTAASVQTTGASLDATGLLLVSGTGNPFTTQRSHTLADAAIQALCVASRPIYNGGFGRYPIYLFTNQGIMALPLLASGNYGEARLLSRVRLQQGCTPVEGGDRVWFVDNHQVLTTVSGSTLTRHLTGCTATALCWNDALQELDLLLPGGTMQVLMAGDVTTLTTLAFQQLYARDGVALAVTASGQVLDLATEQPAAEQSIAWLTHPIALQRKRPTGIVWNLFMPPASTSVQLSNASTSVQLTLRGERGRNAHGFLISRLTVSGPLNAPVAAPVAAQPCRVARLQVSGTAPSGTLLQPVELHLG